MAKITKDMLIKDVLEQGNVNALAEVLYNAGMHCFGCALAHGETVEDAAMVHNLDVDELVAELNAAAKRID